MLMVKSPNDVAVMVAEGVSGSVEAFAHEMNTAAQRLGLHESHFVNPNGLHDPNHVSSARDMAMIARALLREFPDHADLFSIGALQLGRQYIPNHNGLLGRYPGADGMKTGFTCPAGFNVVASANHGGRRLIVVVLGYPTARSRNQEAADLFDRGFGMSGGIGSLDVLPSGSGVAPDTRTNVCLHRNAAALAAAEDAESAPSNAGDAGTAAAGRGATANNPLAALLVPAHTLLSNERPHFDPVPVYVGPAPGWNGPALGPRPIGAASAEAPTASDNAQAVAANAKASAEAQGAQETASVDKAKPKLVRRAAVNIKAQKGIAAKMIKAKADNTNKAKVDNTDKAKTDSTDKDKKDLSTD
jgi:D-alanyl-D-alanine carboxypeptidase